MTPAERARQIDREEFAAECAAIRQRAYTAFNVRPQPETKVREWVKRVEPKRTIKPTFTIRPKPARREAVVKAARTYAKLYTAFGQTRTLTEWATETGMSRNTIRNRLNIGWTLEDALTRTVQEHRKPGVVSDLSAFLGTGGGRHA